MNPVRYTLVTDGSSDRCLQRIINWILEKIPEVASRGFVDQFADLRILAEPPRGLKERLISACKLFPCDVLFVHRDAETETRDTRVDEITVASGVLPELWYIPIIPVRMTEAWLLIDERAIRQAAGNPNGDVDLEMPTRGRLEKLPDPKSILRELLLTASESHGRRRDKFKHELAWRIHRVADLIDDFSSLRKLPAFRAFEADTKDTMQKVIAH